MTSADPQPIPRHASTVATSEPSISFARAKARLKELTPTERARLAKLVKQQGREAPKA